MHKGHEAQSGICVTHYRVSPHILRLQKYCDSLFPSGVCRGKPQKRIINWNKNINDVYTENNTKDFHWNTD